MRYVLHTWTELPFFDCSKGTEQKETKFLKNASKRTRIKRRNFKLKTKE
jgi:hypothetical protein